MTENADDFDAWMSKHYPMFELTGDREADEVSRLVRAVAWDLFKDRAKFLELLTACRNDLPLAAASWNESEDQEVADHHVKRVMGLVSEIDAAIAGAKDA